MQTELKYKSIFRQFEKILVTRFFSASTRKTQVNSGFLSCFDGPATSSLDRTGKKAIKLTVCINFRSLVGTFPASRALR